MMWYHGFKVRNTISMFKFSKASKWLHVGLAMSSTVPQPPLDKITLTSATRKKTPAKGIVHPRLRQCDPKCILPRIHVAFCLVETLLGILMRQKKVLFVQRHGDASRSIV